MSNEKHSDDKGLEGNAFGPRSPLYSSRFALRGAASIAIALTLLATSCAEKERPTYPMVVKAKHVAKDWTEHNSMVVVGANGVEETLEDGWAVSGEKASRDAAIISTYEVGDTIKK